MGGTRLRVDLDTVLRAPRKSPETTSFPIRADVPPGRPEGGNGNGPAADRAQPLDPGQAGCIPEP